MKQGVGVIEGLRYKLRMMGIPLDGHAHVKADNIHVSDQEFQFDRVNVEEEGNSIAYHYVRERAASGAIVVSYEPTETNRTDMLTKTQSGPTRKFLVSNKVLK
jgi:hypothetical protein